MWQDTVQPNRNRREKMRSSGVTGKKVVYDLWQCLSDSLTMEVTSKQGAIKRVAVNNTETT